MENLIGSAEAARVLGVDRSTLVRQVQSGVLMPVHKLPAQTGAYLFDAAYIDGRAAAAAAE